jgi:hypothetical protein
MMRFFLLNILFFVLLQTSYGQTHFNPALKKELDILQMLDQKYRAALVANMRGKGDSLAIVYGVKKEDLNDYLWELQGEIDYLNTVRIEQIISKYGYPGVSLVGEPTNEATFFIIQHSKVIDKYLPLIKEAAEKNELRFQLYAIMLDRSLMFQDKEQIYGTQGSGMSVKNPTNGNWENLSFIWPIKEPSTVNARRKAAGFSQTVEENAKSLDIEYKVFALEEILRLRNEVINAGKD